MVALPRVHERPAAIPPEALRVAKIKDGDSFDKRLSYNIEVGKRASNTFHTERGLRTLPSGEIEKTDLAALSERSSENPHLTHHNEHHVARIKRTFRTLAKKLVPFLPSEQQERLRSQTWLWEAGELALREHDRGQLFSMQRNEDEFRSKKNALDVKKGHDLEAAAMLILSHKEYAQALKQGFRPDVELSEYDLKWHALRVCTAAAIMVMRHGKAETYMNGLQGREKAYTDDGTLRSVAEVKQMYEEGRLDLFSLSFKQLFDWLELEKGAENALHPAFKEFYTAEINSYKESSTPFENIFLFKEGEDKRGDFDFVSELFIRADLSDMLYPPVERIGRSIETKPFKPFFPLSHLLPESGIASEEEFIDKFLEAVRNGPGNDNEADPRFNTHLRRLLWECYHPDPLPGSENSQNLVLQQMHGEVALRSVIALEQLTPLIMEGQYEAAFDKTYQLRIKDLTLQMLRMKHEAGELTQTELEEKVEKLEPELKEVVPGYIVEETVEEYSKRMEVLVRGTTKPRRKPELTAIIEAHKKGIKNIKEDRTKLYEILKDDPNVHASVFMPNDGERNEYMATHQVEVARNMLHAAVAEIAAKYNLENKVEEYRRDIIDGRVARSEFFKSRYDQWLGKGRGWEFSQEAA